ncbi:immunoglobulin superfamily member 1-like isoform X3 [Rhineura floridana]|uniref:immunoglobulin superfamily member 1-like isoform X3 n=1 Tax=Rhineura floridana TaxID=261503 RepID=UPI002AC868A6|nr:immunoglobulin superfamily member 1-like isoform X3 [Rhineura floridana]
MRFSFNILFLGCWLTRQWQMSRGELYPKPSIKVSPSPEVNLQGDFYIDCESKGYTGATFHLFKEGISEPLYSKPASLDAVEFPIFNNKQTDGGIYRCTYCFKNYYDRQCSEYSDEVSINTRGEFYPKPSISVTPSPQVILGTNFFIYCNSKHYQNAAFYLFKEGISEPLSYEVASGSIAVYFILDANQTNGGIYRCVYCFTVHHGRQCSGLSDGLYINIAEQIYPKPSISLSPGEMVTLRGNATIRCKKDKYPKAEFTLHKEVFEGVSDIKKTESGGILFPITNAKQLEAGSYRCIYCIKSDLDFYQQCSNYSDRVSINITDRFSIILWASIPAGLLLLVLILLLLAFVLYRKRRKGSTANDRSQPLNIPLEYDADEVCYAVLNHSSLKTKWAANADRSPDTCTYAALAQGRTKEGQ